MWDQVRSIRERGTTVFLITHYMEEAERLCDRKGLLHFNPAELAQIRSSGEENVGGIAALGKALVLLQCMALDLIQEEEQALTAPALRGLAQIPGLEV